MEDFLPITVQNYDFHETFNTEEEFYAFLEAETNAWKHHKEQCQCSSGICNRIYTNINSLLNAWKAYKTNKFRNVSDKQTLKDQITLFSRKNAEYHQSNVQWIHSENPLVERLKEVECNLNGYASQAFFDAVVNYKVLSHADPSTVSAARLGELLAYNYLVDEEKYQNSLEQKAERIDAIQERMRNREKETYEEIEKCLTSSKNEIENFQSSFREHLRLEAPAQYWEKSSQKYQKSARLWGGVLFLLICIGLIGFFYLYSRFLIGQNLALRLDTVKGVVLFFTGITIYGFQIRVISKLLISSLHLQRDSEERAKLTYFYLSLIKDGAIDEDSRNIIIQSLFSRTDTGLLSGDSSPTMPYIDALKNIKVSS